MFSSGDGECEIDPSYVNPIHLASKVYPSYSSFGDVEGEVEIPGYEEHYSVTSDDDYDYDDDEKDQSITDMSTSTSTNKTITRKVTSTSTINRVRSETSKTSSKDGEDVNRSQTSRISHSSSTQEHQGGSGYDDYYDYYDSAEYPDETYDHRRPGSRTHSRVSRKVYTTRTEKRRQDGSNRHMEGELAGAKENRVSSRTQASRTSINSVDDENDLTIIDEDDGFYSHSRSGVKNDPETTRRTDHSRNRQSSSRRFETSPRTSSNSLDNRENNLNHVSRFDERQRFSSRNDIHRSRNEDDWDRRTFDGGRGVEEKRRYNRTFTTGDGSRVQEARNEFKSTHTSDSSPDSLEGDNQFYKRTEQSHSVHNRKMTSSNSGRVGGSSDRQNHLDSRFSPNMNDNSFNRNRNNDGWNDGSEYHTGRNSNWDTRTFDSGRGREERRRTSNSYTNDRGAKVTQDRNEIRRTHISNSFNPESNSESTISSRRYDSGHRSRNMDVSEGSSGYSHQNIGEDRKNDYDSDRSSYDRKNEHFDRSNPSSRSSSGAVHFGRSNSESRGSARSPQGQSVNRDDDFSSGKSYSSQSSSTNIRRTSPESRWNSGGFKSETVNEEDGGRTLGGRTDSTRSWNSDSSVDHSSGNYEYDYDLYDDYDVGDQKSDRGRTYTTTVIDDRTGKGNVYSRREFGNHKTAWKDPDSSITDAGSHDDLSHSLRRVKRDNEMIVQPEAYTDDKTGRTLQVVNLVSSDLYSLISLNS